MKWLNIHEGGETKKCRPLCGHVSLIVLFIFSAFKQKTHYIHYLWATWAYGLTPVEDLLSMQTEPFHALVKRFVVNVYAQKAQKPRSRVDKLIFGKPFFLKAWLRTRDETGWMKAVGIMSFLFVPPKTCFCFSSMKSTNERDNNVVFFWR